MCAEKIIRVFKNKENQLAVIIIFILLVYGNIFHNEFVWDDKNFILKWAEIRSLKNIPSFLEGVTPYGQEGIYRPLRSIFYTLSYKLWHLNPVGYHFQSILVHLACAILIYFITLQITREKVIAFMTSILFGIHPVHTESITFITSSFDIIGIIFFLLSFYLYLKAQPTEDKYWTYFVISIIFSLLAFFTYEMTLTLPLLIVFYDLCFKKIKKNLVGKLMLYSPYFIVAFFYLFIRVFILNIGKRGAYIADSVYVTMLTMAKVLLKYISLMIIPIKLNVDHTISKRILSFTGEISKETAMQQSIFDSHVLLLIAIIIILLVVSVKSFKKYPLVSFCIGWFFIGLVPVLNIIPLPFILAERYLYISSFSFCLLFSFITYHAYNVISKKNKIEYIQIGLIILLIFTILSYSTLTISRNKDWKNEITLWSKTVEQSPESLISHNNLGAAYQNSRKIDLAIEEYKKVLSISPNFPPAYYNLGNIYRDRGQLNLAIDAYQAALKINPEFAEVHNDLGIIYLNQGNLYLATKEYQAALKINPEFAEAHNNLGISYYKQGKIDLAIKEFQEALRIDPNYAYARNNLNKIYREQGK